MPVFVPKTERAIWGRLAYITEAQSRNQLHQELLLDGLRHRGMTDWADKIEAARAEYRAVAINVAQKAVMVFALACVLFAKDLLRARRRRSDDLDAETFASLVVKEVA
jgi:hypothetical protein